MHGTITWDEDRSTGLGRLTLTTDTGKRESIPYDGPPIDAGTNSSDIAWMFGQWDSVDHDGEYIHVAR